MSNEAWLQERKKGIGGSDIASVFNIEPYGCAAQLFDDKRDVPVDHEDPDRQKFFDRGHELEPATIRNYIEVSGNKVVHGEELAELALSKDNPFKDRCDSIITMNNGVKEVSFSLKGFPHRKANIDGLIVMPDGKHGVLECKTAFREIFYGIKKNGIPEHYILQGQHYLGVLGLTWGAYNVLWPDGWTFEQAEFQRDEGLIETVFDAVDRTWKQVENGPRPDRLAPDDKRCKKCTRRRTCQGDYLLQSIKEEGCDIPDLSDDQEFAQAAHDYMEAKEIVDGGTILLEKAKDTLKELIGTRPLVMGAGLKIHYKPQTRVGWDTKALAKKHPELVPLFKTKESVSRPFKPFII